MRKFSKLFTSIFKSKYFIVLLSAFLLLTGCSSLENKIEDKTNISIEDSGKLDLDQEALDEYGYYTDTESVAKYIIYYGKLPANYISKKEAKSLGWNSKEGNLWQVTDKKSIGGDRFGNYEGLLPKDKTYYECDINYEGGFRGSERLIYSSDGLIYYTGDHYKTFEEIKLKD